MQSLTKQPTNHNQPAQPTTQRAIRSNCTCAGLQLTASSMGRFLRNHGCCLICVSVMRSAGLATKMRASRSWHSGLIFSAGGIKYLTARMRCRTDRQEDMRSAHITRPAQDSDREAKHRKATCRLADSHPHTGLSVCWQAPSARFDKIQSCGNSWQQQHEAADRSGCGVGTHLDCFAEVAWVCVVLKGVGTH